MRRHATLVAVVLEAKATVIDEIVDLNDRIIGTLFNRARRHHEQQFQESGKAINEKVRLFYRVGQALLEAKQNGGDPFKAIEAVISVGGVHAERDRGREARPAGRLRLPASDRRRLQPDSPVRARVPRSADHEGRPGRRDILTAVETLKALNADNTRKVPADAPTGFVRKRWEGLVFTETGVDRRFYELCTLSELKNALRSGDIWVAGFAPVQGLRRIPGAGREVRRCSNSPANCRSRWTPTATRSCASGSCCSNSNSPPSTAWRGPTSCRRPVSSIGTENWNSDSHTARSSGCSGSRSGRILPWTDFVRTDPYRLSTLSRKSSSEGGSIPSGFTNASETRGREMWFPVSHRRWRWSRRNPCQGN